MNTIDAARSQIQQLYRTHPDVHVNVVLRNPRSLLTNVPVVIKEVYPHVFKVEDRSAGLPRTYVHQYGEMITKEIEILELADRSADAG